MLEAHHGDGISTKKTQGGVADNANNAQASIHSFFSAAEEAANGLDADGEVVRTIVNEGKFAVAKRPLVVGSPVHKNHLHMGHFRANSVGGKEDMHSPNHLQMAFKWAAILKNDAVVSTRGTSSLYKCALVEFFGGPGPWSKSLKPDNEGRWGVSQIVLRDIKAVMDKPAPGDSTMNGLAGAALHIRSLLKPKSWRIEACLEVAAWSGAKLIQFAIVLELEIGEFYERELNWYRKSSDRKYLSHYSVLYRLRELPGHLRDIRGAFIFKVPTPP